MTIRDPYMRYISELARYMSGVANYNYIGDNFHMGVQMDRDINHYLFSIFQNEAGTIWTGPDDIDRDMPDPTEVRQLLINCIPHWNAYTFASYVSTYSKEPWNLLVDGRWHALYTSRVVINEDTVLLYSDGTEWVFDRDEQVQGACIHSTQTVFPDMPQEVANLCSKPLIETVDRIAIDMGYYKTVDMHPYLKKVEGKIIHAYSSITSPDVLVLNHDVTTGDIEWMHDNGDSIEVIDPIPVSGLKDFFFEHAPRISPDGLFKRVTRSNSVKFDVWIENSWKSVTEMQNLGNGYLLKSHDCEFRIESDLVLPVRVKN